jgi:ERO1-like protein alpha
MQKLRLSLLLYAASCLTFFAVVHWLYPSEYSLQGKIGDCCCVSSDTLKQTNQQISGKLVDLVKTKFFRIFNVDIDDECPFWAQTSICMFQSCQMDECDASMIPTHWIELDRADQIKLDRDFDPHWPKDENMLKDDQWQWRVEEFAPSSGVYIDLRENDEAYTGYQGQHIWKIIYQENCFQGELDDLCSEERTLNRILMGMHSSVSSHLSEFYSDLEAKVPKSYPNPAMYFEKVGNHADRIRNLYYYYSFLLRAINNAANKLTNFNFTSDDPVSDAKTKRLIDEILEVTTGQCDTPFQEHEFMKSFKNR